MRSDNSRPRPVNDVSWLDSTIRRGSTWPTWLLVTLIACMVAVAWALTWATGGSQRAFPHLFYVPIIIAAMLFGLRGGIPTAVVSAVVVGPFMPFDTVSGEAQLTSGWIVRGVMFCVVAGAASLAMAIRQRVQDQMLTVEVRERISRSQAVTHVDESLAPALRQVLEESSFHIVYQPAYRLSDGALVAVEALTRFDVEPRRTPDVWFQTAADAGLGTELELATIAKAATGAETVLPRHITLAVNASPTTLADPRLRAIIAAHPERTFAIEITEHAVVEDYRLLSEHLADLRVLGVRFAVDDTGAGFSSLRHIVQLTPDIIKIDLSLAQGVGTSALKRALAGSLTEFAHAAGARMVIEGIEDVEDLLAWSQLGAEAVQGYLTGRPGPLPVEELSAVIASLRARIDA